MNKYNIHELLELAELAKANPSLVANHRGTVDRHLSERLAVNEELCKLLAGNPDFVETIATMREESALIADALKVYNPQIIEVVVTLANGDTITTRINATLEEARTYYLGHEFGEGPEFLAVKVEEVGA